MHQTIYIDVDEEITSILDRIRQEKVMEIYLVVPKGAMLINSIINLKLLKKESEGMGKNVTIVAPNDKRSRNIIERSGIRVEEYNEQINKNSLQGMVSNDSAPATNIQQASTEAVRETQQQIKQDDTNLGSNSFFNESNGGRNSSESVNLKESQATQTEVNRATVQNASPIVEQSTPVQPNQDLEAKEFNYFNNSAEHNGQNNSVFSESSQSQTDSLLSKYKFLLVGLIVLVVFLFGVASWFFANYPKLEVVVHPLKKELSKEVKITAQDGVSQIDVENKIIPGEYLEMSLEKTMDFKATGSKVIDKNASRASGTVTIYNYFSTKPQALIKTTRVLSVKDKKLFRLTKNVIVPGMVGDEPGKIEVPVQADKNGKDFNITADSFTIEGFKSKPEKYKKFKVVSTEPMRGGSMSADAKTKNIITKQDLDTARKKTIEALDNEAVAEIKKRLNSSQEVIEDAINKEIISSKASLPENAVTDTFSYTVVYKVKLMAFNKNDVRKIVSEVTQDDLQKEYQLDQGFTMDLKRGIVDLDKKTLTIYADVIGSAWFDIDKDNIKQSIAGTTGEVTKQSLNKDVGVDTAELRPSPTWINKAPKDLDKIVIKVIQTE